MKKLLPIAVVIILLFVIKNNITSIINTIKDENTAANFKKKLAQEEKENQFLKERLSYVKGNQFVEKEAREKLFMTRPGEFIVIGPASTPVGQEKIEIDTRPNWRRWWDLFF